MSASIAVVIVAHNHASEIAETVRSVLTQLGEADELLVVDNASRDSTLDRVRAIDGRCRLLALPDNVGFAAGCNTGAQQTTSQLLFFLNPDARLEDGCLDALRAAGERHPQWAAWQALVLMPDRMTVNSCGNVSHFLGFGWAGGHGRPSAELAVGESEPSFASGAALMVRRSAWDRAGGFDGGYFAYGEDLELCLRLRLSGWRIGMTPSARVIHDYEFDKGKLKWFLLERNRWRTLIRIYPAALLMAVAPALACVELLLLAVAWRQGWLRAKLRAQLATARQLPELVRLRAQVQPTRRTSVRRFASEALSDSLDSRFLAVGRVAARMQRLYWRVALRLLPTSRPTATITPKPESSNPSRKPGA